MSNFEETLDFNFLGKLLVYYSERPDETSIQCRFHSNRKTWYNNVESPHLNDERVVLVEFCQQTIEEIFLG